MTHPLTGAWRVVWKQPVSRRTLDIRHLSFGAIATRPVQPKDMRQLIDVERRTFQDIIDVECEGVPMTLTLHGTLVGDDIPTEPPIHLDVVFETAAVTCLERPEWACEAPVHDVSAHAEVIVLSDEKRVDRDAGKRVALLERSSLW